MKIGAALKVNGISLETTEEGFLCNLNDWNDEVAREIARINQISLGQEHWEIVRFIRGYYYKYQHLPNARVFSKAIRNQLGAEKGNSRYLHRLFPEGPLKYACKIAGLPKPPTCL
jgi:tRNA 2-thiouridine synthesizing protein E